MVDWTMARTKMVDNQLRTSGVTAYSVLDAMGEVAREAFVPTSLKTLSYIDDDLTVRDADEAGPARYMMRPASFAKLAQLARPGAEDVALLIGCGTGYGAAVLARIVSAVVALESDAELAAKASEILPKLGIDNAAVVSGPLHEGWAAEGPYDIIILEGAVEEIPAALFDQLKVGGRLVAVTGTGLSGEAVLYTRSESGISGRPSLNLSLKPLPGFEKPKAFAF